MFNLGSTEKYEKLCNELQERRLDNRRELDDVKITVHRIEDQLEKKQNRLSFGWVISVLIFLFSTVGTAVYWGGMMSQKMDNLVFTVKQGTEDRFTGQDAKVQFSIRDQEHARHVIMMKNNLNKIDELQDQLDSLEDTVNTMYSHNRNKK